MGLGDVCVWMVVRAPGPDRLTRGACVDRSSQRAGREALLCSEVGEMSRAAEGAEADCDVLGEGTVCPGGHVPTMS